MGNVGRPKLEIARDKAITIRLTNFEFEKISRLAEKLKISKTETILRGIKLLETPQRQIITRSQLPNFKPKISKKSSEGVIEEETIMFDKK